MKQIILVFTTVFIFAGHTSFAQTFTVGFATGEAGLTGHGFADMTYSGLVKARQKYGIRLVIEVPGEGDSAFDDSLRRLIAKQPDIIVANGSEYFNFVKKYAAQYPKQRFLINGPPTEGFPNVISIVYAQHEGSFLAGVLAGLMTKTHAVGFVGGVDINTIHQFRIGYREGVRHANPAVKILETFIAKGKDFSGFNNPDRGKKLALEQYQQGADIIFAVAGTSSNGVIHAAQQQKKFAIGVDSDQDGMAKGYVLTSMMKRLDLTAFQEISKMIEGKFQPGIKIYGLKEGGVSLSPMKYTKHLIPEHILQKLRDVEKKIISGDISVTNYLEQQQK